MRIGLLSTSFPRFEGDVAGHFVLGFAQALAGLGHEIEVLAPAPREPWLRAGPSFGAVRVQWVRYLWPQRLQRSFYGAGVLDNLRGDSLAWLGLAPFVAGLAGATARRVARWDALISHWALPCALVAGALCRDRPQLAVLHSADVFTLERLPLRARAAAAIVERADALLFVSRELRSRFLALLPPLARSRAAGRAHVCAMGIAPQKARGETRAQLRARLGLTRFTLLSLGRLIALKGVDHLIDALTGQEGVELLVVGDGPERQRLEARARGAAVAVRFVGQVGTQDKDAWFAAADAFVLPSIRLPDGRSEGMPTALLEAMEHGLPVIASQVGGVADVVRHGENGLLVPPADAGAIRAAISQLRDDRTQCAALQREARETARMYHWSELGPRFEALLVGEGDQ